MLAVIGALSARLKLSVLVSNVAYQHPFFVLRQCAELAFLFGGERVIGGIGAGWNAEEFEGLGYAMASHQQRLERLQEAAAIARSWLDTGSVTFQGRHITVRELPRINLSGPPPKLAVGGGSLGAISIAAEYADHVDFDAPSHRLPLTDTLNGVSARAKDIKRRFMTDDDDLIESRRILDEKLVEFNRPNHSVTASINVTELRIGQSNQLRGILDSVNRRYALDLTGRELNVRSKSSPFILIGRSEELWEIVSRRFDRLGLDFMVLPDNAATEVFLENLST